MRKNLIALLLVVTLSLNAQDFVAAENDTTVLTEYNDGRLWAYRQIGDFVVGMTNYEGKDDYGRYYQTTYTTTYGVNHVPYTQVHTTYNYAAASAANMAATTQMMTLSKLMADDRNTKSQGYLRITTIHPNEGIIGYMNIKRKKGQMMTVNIPVGGQIYSFDWDVTKKKVKK